MAKFNKTLADRITTLVAEQLCSISDICKATGISRNTFYKWKRENPDFSEELEEAMEYRNEVLLSMAYSSIKQRLERHTLVEERDVYIPDEDNPGGVKFKNKIIKKKECLPDLRTIKMILNRTDKKKDKAKVQKKEDVHVVEQLPEPVKENTKIDTIGTEIITTEVKSENRKASIRNIKSKIRMIDNSKVHRWERNKKMVKESA